MDPPLPGYDPSDHKKSKSSLSTLYPCKFLCVAAFCMGAEKCKEIQPVPIHPRVGTCSSTIATVHPFFAVSISWSPRLTLALFSNDFYYGVNLISDEKEGDMNLCLSPVSAALCLCRYLVREVLC